MYTMHTTSPRPVATTHSLKLVQRKYSPQPQPTPADIDHMATMLLCIVILKQQKCGQICLAKGIPPYLTVQALAALKTSRGLAPKANLCVSTQAIKQHQSAAELHHLRLYHRSTTS
jgi:hypothetical protein